MHDDCDASRMIQEHVTCRIASMLYKITMERLALYIYLSSLAKAQHLESCTVRLGTCSAGYSGGRSTYNQNKHNHRVNVLPRLVLPVTGNYCCFTWFAASKLSRADTALNEGHLAAGGEQRPGLWRPSFGSFSSLLTGLSFTR